MRGQERCEIHTLKGANMSVRAEAIRLMGGFDRNYTGTALLEERLRMTPQERQLADLRRNDYIYRPGLLETKPARHPDGGPKLSDE